MKHHMPPGIAILQSIVRRLEGVDSFLIKGSANYVLLQTVLSESRCFNEDKRFLENEGFITYIQMMLLAGMSMFGGVSLSCLNMFSDNGEMISLTWDSGVSDRFSWGIYDDSLLQFMSYYQDRLSSKAQNKKYLPVDILIGIRGFFSTYLHILGSLDSKISRFLVDKETFLSMVSSEVHRDVLFLVLSSLPIEHLSRFFMVLYPCLPPDLMVTSPDGRSMSLRAMFDNPSSDFTYLGEKLKLFMDLYYNENYPKMRRVTKEKALEFLHSVVRNDHDFKRTQDNIKSVKKSQIDVRNTLYSTLKNHLDELVYV